jgi:hypothetical protein
MYAAVHGRARRSTPARPLITRKLFQQPNLAHRPAPERSLLQPGAVTGLPPAPDRHRPRPQLRLGPPGHAELSSRRKSVGHHSNGETLMASHRSSPYASLVRGSGQAAARFHVPQPRACTSLGPARQTPGAAKSRRAGAQIMVAPQTQAAGPGQTLAVWNGSRVWRHRTFLPRVRSGACSPCSLALDEARRSYRNCNIQGCRRLHGSPLYTAEVNTHIERSPRCAPPNPQLQPLPT